MLWAVVPAAGRGARMDTGVPKQYLRLGDRTVIEHALAPLLAYPEIEAVCVVLDPGDAHWAKLAIANDPVIRTAVGGASRAASVSAGLAALDEAADDDLVLVHDAARPCLRGDDLDSLVRAARRARHGALLAVPARDTLKQVADHRVTATLDRAGIWQAQTPQVFRYAVLRDALADAADANATSDITDEASAIERLGGQPTVVAGHGDNIKVTWLDDLPMAEASLRAQGRLPPAGHAAS